MEEAALVPGIEFYDDKLHQGRTFSYVDTQRYHLGANFHTLSTKRLLCSVTNNQRDGVMQSQVFQGPVNYNYGPSSQGGPVATPPEGSVYSPYIEGNLAREKIKKTDDFT